MIVLAALSLCLPRPIGDIGIVFKVFMRIRSGVFDRLLKLQQQCWPLGKCSPRALDGLRRQMVTAHPIEDDHQEWRGRRPLLVEAAHMKAFGVFPSVDNFVNRPLIAMKGENNRFGAGKQIAELLAIHAMWVRLGGKQRHQIHDVDEAHPQIWQMLAQPLCRRQRRR